MCPNFGTLKIINFPFGVPIHKRITVDNFQVSHCKNDNSAIFVFQLYPLSYNIGSVFKLYFFYINGFFQISVFEIIGVN